LTENGSRWSKKQKRRSEARESKSLDKKIEEKISARKMDRGQVNKLKKASMNCLEHLAGKKERQACENLKIWVKLT
jgi:hypothetical protein